MSGTTLLGVISLICIGDIAIALYLLAKANRVGDTLDSAPRSGAFDPVGARRVARLMLIATPVTWLFVAALCFGLLGPVGGITPIRVNAFYPGAVRTAMRARAMPGENPDTLPRPAVLAPKLIDMIAPEFTDNRMVFDWEKSELRAL